MRFLFGQQQLRISYDALILFALGIVVAGFLFQTVSAQGPTPTDNEINQIAKQLYCPVCESTPLDVCPTEACRQWRELIRTMLTEGKTEAEIKQYFVQQYGVRVLNEPPNRLVSYIVPTIVILLGAFMLFRGFQAWKKPIASESISGRSPHIEAEPSGRTEPKPLQDEYILRMEEELKKRK